MTEPTRTLDAALEDHTVVVEVPPGGVDDWVAVGEILLQEGLAAWALPPSSIGCLPEVLALFGRRARVGVTGLTDAAGVRAAAGAGAHFLLACLADPSLAEAAAGVPLIPGALTPSEVAAAARAGADTVMVVPADALGSSYARVLPGLFPDVALVASGRLEHYQCSMWLDAGARATVVSDVILRRGDHAGANALDEVADRAGNYRPLALRGVG